MIVRRGKVSSNPNIGSSGIHSKKSKMGPLPATCTMHAFAGFLALCLNGHQPTGTNHSPTGI